MEADATNRVHGLGMTPEEFWSSTPRELAVHRTVRENAMRFFEYRFAELQATLHNAHWVRERSQPPFTADMFLSDYKPDSKPDESWKIVKATAMNARKMTLEERRAVDEHVQDFATRQSQAAALKASGGTREQVIALMEGR